MKKISQVFNWLSSLKIAIFLLFVIAIFCALGTAIPQLENDEFYLNNFNESPFIGLLNGQTLLFLQLNKIYTSIYFLSLLSWLGIALAVCSWRRQLPMLESALKWIDYKSPRQIAKLSIAQTLPTNNPSLSLNNLTKKLREKGWNIKENNRRIAARKGVIGRIGPILIHFGMIILMIGATYGGLNGETLEKFLVPGRSIELSDRNEERKLTIELKNFQIDRDPKGRAEQYRSLINIAEPGAKIKEKEISVNYPFRYKGITIYQADWSLAAVTIQIDNSPKLQIPIQPIPELGEQVWGTIIPTKTNGEEPILLTMNNELGPVLIYDKNGTKLATLSIEENPKQIGESFIKIISIIPSSGLLLKHDPGVPLVYTSFAIILFGGFLSVISTNKIWALYEEDKSLLFIGGLSNRNHSGLSKELPDLIKTI